MLPSPAAGLLIARPRKLALHGWLGLGLLAVFWPLNWLLSGPRTYWCYVPLWWGLALALDALCLRYRGTSLLSRSRLEVLRMSAVSMPAWWMFEAINKWYARDWYFEGGDLFISFPLGLFGTLALSALLPVMVASAELLGDKGLIKRVETRNGLRLERRRAAFPFVIGLILLCLVALWPHYLYGLVWLALFLVLDSTNLWLGHPSLIWSAVEGDWRPLFYLGVGGMVVGIFSEVWNYYSYPKWRYDVPFGDFWHVFELPLLGYAAFPTVAWEMYSVYALLGGWLASRTDR